MKYLPITLILLVWGLPAPAWAQLVASHTPVFQQEAPAILLSDKPVARVNAAVLTDRDLLREMYAIFPYARQHNGAFPKAMEADIRKGALQMIEFEELVYQEALRRKMTVAPTRLDKAEISFRQQFQNPDQYQMFMRIECQGQRSILRAKIRRSLLIEDLLKVEVTGKSAVSIPQAKAWFDQHPERFRIPESFAIQTISVVPPPTPTPEQLKEARRRAEDDFRQAKATKSYEEFGLLAEKISQDDYRVMMGDHRLLDRAKLPPQILTVVEQMRPGQVSDVVQVEQVYTIVRLNNHVPTGMQKFVDVKDSLRQYLQKQNVERLRAGLNSRLRKDAKVEEP